MTSYGIAERVGSLARDVAWEARNPVSRSPSSNGYAPAGSRALTEYLAHRATETRIDALVAHREAHREEREAFEQWEARGGSPAAFFAAWDDDEFEERLADLDRSGAEIRFYHNGTPVYGEDPTGNYPTGRAWEHRFWVDGPGEGAVSRVYPFTAADR